MALLNWNGYVLPEAPYELYKTGSSCIYLNGGNIYFVYLDWTGMKIFTVNRALNIFWPQRSGRRWILQGEEWVETDGVSSAEDTGEGVPYDELIWSNKTIRSALTATSLYSPSNPIVFEVSESPATTDFVTSIEISAPDTVQKGFFCIVTAIVSGKGDFDKTVTATISGAKDTSGVSITKISAGKSGFVFTLYCGDKESASEITVTATSVAFPNVSGSKTIAVVGSSSDGGSGGGTGGGSGGTDGGGDSGGEDIPSDPLITNISLSIIPDTVVPGSFALANVVVDGIGDYNHDFTAALSGQTGNTYFVKGSGLCNIWVGADETAEYIFLTVTSVHDPSMSATEMLYIDHSGTEEEGTTAEQLQRAYWSGFATAKAYFKRATLSASVTISVTRETEEPEDAAGQIKRAYWKGFVAGVGMCGFAAAESGGGSGESANNWPIEWTQSMVAGNAQIDAETFIFTKVSDLNVTPELLGTSLLEAIIFNAENPEENVLLENSAAGSFEEIFGAMKVFYIFSGGDYLILYLISANAGTYDDMTVPETGLYYALLDGNMQNFALEGIDFKFKLTQG